MIRDQRPDSDESSYDSAASRIEFWRDINTKDADYKRAVFLKREKAEANHQKFGRG